MLFDVSPNAWSSAIIYFFQGSSPSLRDLHRPACSLPSVLSRLFLGYRLIILCILIRFFSWFRNLTCSSLGSSSFEFGDFCLRSLYRRGFFRDRFPATAARASGNFGDFILTGQHEGEAYILDLSCSTRGIRRSGWKRGALFTYAAPRCRIRNFSSRAEVR